MNPAERPPFFDHFFLMFVGMWLGVTSLLGLLSGWYFLMWKFPDRPEAPLLKLRWQSGWMGLGVSMGGILTLSACPSGLRVGIFRLFGIFERDFFVPWESIRVTRTTTFFIPMVELHFEGVRLGRLGLQEHVADRLRRSVPDRWPEPGPPPARETSQQVFAAVSKRWLMMTVFASAFFLGAPRLMGSKGDGPPPAVAIIFPAIVFGVASLVEYVRRVKD